MVEPGIDWEMEYDEDFQFHQGLSRLLPRVGTPSFRYIPFNSIKDYP